MLPTRFGAGQPSAVRKSRLDPKPSLLPKPFRANSIDRHSDARRPSSTRRSSSADPPRSTLSGINRLSKDALANKGPNNMKSRTPSGYTTPLRSTNYYRGTITPGKSPSEDPKSRGWQVSLERALAFVTIKDQRPLSNVAWQRSELARVQAALADRAGGEGAPPALVRPLTIARFVDVTGGLLAAITGDTKLSTDNYIVKLPVVCKRLLYPGVMSKSWLQSVNTLHAFPHALALISYLLDMLNRIETPLSEEELYIKKDEVTQLQREYVSKCWSRFQETDPDYSDLCDEYLSNLKELVLGNIEEKFASVAEQHDTHKRDVAEACRQVTALRVRETAMREHMEALAAAVRRQREETEAARANAEAARAAIADNERAAQLLDNEIERATAECATVRRELEEQTMTVEEYKRTMDEVLYANRVNSSKKELIQEIEKMITNKENELTDWLLSTLHSCNQLKQGLVQLSACCPELADLDINEQELIGAECSSRVSEVVERLRAHAHSLAERRSTVARERAAHDRRREALLEEGRARAGEVCAALERERQAVEREAVEERDEARAAVEREQQAADALADFRRRIAQLDALRADIHLQHHQQLCEQKGASAAATREHVEAMRASLPRLLQEARARRMALVTNRIRQWRDCLNPIA